MKRCTAKCCARVPAKLHLLARLSLQGCLWQGEAFMLFWRDRERPPIKFHSSAKARSGTVTGSLCFC